MPPCRACPPPIVPSSPITPPFSSKYLKHMFNMSVIAMQSFKSIAKLEWLFTDNLSSPLYSDLYDVFLLHIIDRDTRQNPWTMIYRSQWPPISMRSLTVSDWTSIKSMMHKWIIFSVCGWGGVAARMSEIFFLQRIRKVNFFIKNPNVTKNSGGWEGRVWGCG